MRRTLLVSIMLLPLSAFTSPAFGQPAQIERLERRIAKLERLVSALTQRVARLEAAGKSGAASAGRGSAIAWQNRLNWKRLRNNMTTEEVKDVLGEPQRVQTDAHYTYWYYDPDKPNNLGAHVKFDPDTVKLKGWKAPEFR